MSSELRPEVFKKMSDKTARGIGLEIIEAEQLLNEIERLNTRPAPEAEQGEAWGKYSVSRDNDGRWWLNQMRGKDHHATGRDREADNKFAEKEARHLAAWLNGGTENITPPPSSGAIERAAKVEDLARLALDMLKDLADAAEKLPDAEDEITDVEHEKRWGKYHSILAAARVLIAKQTTLRGVDRG